jgi:hypothetical protein
MRLVQYMVLQLLMLSCQFANACVWVWYETQSDYQTS